MANFKYTVVENVGAGNKLPVASLAGFPTEDDAKAAGEKEAERIAKSSKRTLSVDVSRIE